MKKSRIAAVVGAMLALVGSSALAKTAIHDDAGIKGRLSYHYIDPAGNRITDAQAREYGLPAASGVVENMVVTTGKNLMAALWAGTAVLPPTHLAIGSGSTAEAVGQTALVTETARVALDTRSSTGNVTTDIGTIPAGTGTGTVNEVGLFNAASVGTMTQRALTGAITKPAGLGLQFTWTTTFN